MLQTESRISTEQASRYIKRLCKHFAHKLETQWDEQRGVIHFAMGTCTLRARQDQLQVCCEAANPQDLDMVADCIKDHFDRFAWQETVTLEWQNHPSR